MVDKLGAGGLDDWEVKIADFVVLLGKNAKKVRDAANRAKGLWGIRLRWRKRCLTPLIILDPFNYSVGERCEKGFLTPQIEVKACGE